MPFTRTVAVARCSRPGHQNARVVANGRYERGTARYQGYRCTPHVGPVHRFSVRLDGGAPVRGQPGASDCVKHPRAEVVRNGRYGKKGGRRRQRYRCAHAACNDLCRPGCRGHHSFTPAIPRSHVCTGDTCLVCRERTPIHRGSQSAARRSQVTPSVATKALAEMSLRQSYATAGREALEGLGLDPTIRRRRPNRRPLKPRRRWSRRKQRKRSAATRLAGRFWQVAAGIVEAFGPIVWAAAEERLRERSAAIVARGEKRVWILDEIPVYALATNGKRKKSDGWVVLVLAEMDWADKAAPGVTKLRLVRAMPKANSTAWRLVFAEVGYPPDIIVSDAATSIVAAVGRHFDGPNAPLLVPSLWHLGRALENNAFEKALKESNGRDIRTHLYELKRENGAISSVADWIGWWDHLAVLAKASGLVKMDALRQTRANYEVRMASAIPVLAADPRLLVSTGGLESIIRDAIEPVLERRRHQFANIERTNHLLDLIVARSVGMFAKPAIVEDLIVADALDYDGWTVPMRTIADPQPAYRSYRSLRDEMLLLAVAEERGIAL